MKTRQVAAEASNRSAAARFLRLRPLTVAMLGAALLAPQAILAQQLPVGPSVIAGSARISSNGGRMDIVNAPGTVINWQGFSIGAQNAVNFQQQSAASQVLNRVTGSDPSTILGNLTSNGQVWLINPNGVLFGKGARVDVAGLVASTLALSDGDFLAHRASFAASGDTRSGSVINRGQIRTTLGGRVWLLGDQVGNEGLITTPGGQIVLAAGRSIELVDSGAPNVIVRISAPENTAVNLGELLASDGEIDIHAGQINQQGIVRADSTRVDAQGRIQLTASSGVVLGAHSETSADGAWQGGNVSIDGGAGQTLASGSISARGTDGIGGRITVLGHEVGILDQARLDASGTSGGGEIFVGGGQQGLDPALTNAHATYFAPTATLAANALTKGDGGRIIVWSDAATRVYGHMEAMGGPAGGNGGFIETSGGWLDARPAALSVAAPLGKSGTWLLDPNDITITSLPLDLNISSGPDFSSTGDSATLSTATINAALDSGQNVVIQTSTNGSDTEAGNISLSGAIETVGSGASLTLRAHRNIYIREASSIVSTGGPLATTFVSDSDGNSHGSISMAPNTNISTKGGGILFMGGALDGYSRGTFDSSGVGILLSGAKLDAQGGSVTLRGGAGGGDPTYTPHGIAIRNGSQVLGGSIDIDGVGNVTSYGNAINIDGASTIIGQNVNVHVSGSINSSIAISGNVRVDATSGLMIDGGDSDVFIAKDVSGAAPHITASGNAPIFIGGRRVSITGSPDALIGNTSGYFGEIIFRGDVIDLGTETAGLRILTDGPLSLLSRGNDLDVWLGNPTLSIHLGARTQIGDTATNNLIIKGVGATFPGPVDVIARNNIELQDSLTFAPQLLTNDAPITLTSDIDGNGSGAIYLEAGSKIGTHGGDITLKGGAADGYARGTAETTGHGISLEGNLDYGLGVLADGALLDAGAGSVTLKGAAGMEGMFFAPSGVEMLEGARIVGARIQIDGVGLASGSDSYGTVVNGANISGDTISISGQGRNIYAGIEIQGGGRISANTSISLEADTIRLGTGSFGPQILTDGMLSIRSPGADLSVAINNVIFSSSSGSRVQIGDSTTNNVVISGSGATFAGPLDVTAKGNIELVSNLSGSLVPQIAMAGTPVSFTSDADGNGSGAIRTSGGSSIRTNGGDITFKGGAADGYARGSVGTAGVGISLNGTTLDAGGGNVSLKGAAGLGASSSQVAAGVEILSASIAGNKMHIEGTGAVPAVADAVGVHIAGSSVSGTLVDILGEGSVGHGPRFGVDISFNALLFASSGLSIDGGGGGVALIQQNGSSASISASGNAPIMIIGGQVAVNGNVGTFIGGSSGYSGNVTFRAGSIFLEADGDFGPRVFTTGTVSLLPLSSGASLFASLSNPTFSTSSVMVQVGDSTTSRLTVAGLGATFSSPVSFRAASVVFQPGVTIVGNAPAEAITVVATRIFDNFSGANVFSAPNGRYLIYSNNPVSDNLNSLSYDFRQVGLTYPEQPIGTGNGIIYSTPSTGIVSISRPYDGTNIASYGVGTAANSSVGVTGTIGSAISGTFADKSVGDVKPVTPQFLTTVDFIDEAGKPLYGLIPSLSGVITALPLNVVGVVASDKIYDGSNLAGTSGGSLNGVIQGDSVSLALLKGEFVDKNVGSAKAVVVSASLTGADAGNYVLVAPQGRASITPAPLVYLANSVQGISGSALPLLSGTVSGFVGGDSLASSTSGELGWSTTATSRSGAGVYSVNGGGLSASNYGLLQAASNASALVLQSGVQSVGSQQPAVIAAVQSLPSGPPTLIEAQERPAPVLAPVAIEPLVQSRRDAVLDHSSSALPVFAGFNDLYGRFNFDLLNFDEIGRILESRHRMKKKIFASAIYKLDEDPTLADVPSCRTIGEAATGACMLTESVRNQSVARHNKEVWRQTRPLLKTALLPQIERKIAVLIGINEYTDSVIPPLQNAVPDAEAVSQFFAKQLGYEVRVLRNPTKAQIVATLNQLSTEVEQSDSVVVYYAGHGYMNDDSGAGYWIPGNALASDPGNWLSNADISKMLTNVPARQLALISDSCYSGTLTREQMLGDDSRHASQPADVLNRRSVVVMSSGSEEPVADGGKDGHSIFAWSLMETLRSVDKWQSGASIFEMVKRDVTRESPQTPQYGAILSAGHEAGGEYFYEFRQYDMTAR